MRALPHLFFILVIAVLGTWIVQQTINDRDAILQGHLQKACLVFSQIVMQENEESFSFLKEITEDFSIATSQKYVDKALQAIQQTDSVLVWTNAIEHPQNGAAVAKVQAKMDSFRTVMWGIADYDTLIASPFQSTQPQNGLCDTWKNGTSAQYQTALAQLRYNTLCLQNYVLWYCNRKTAMCVADMRFNPTPKFLYDCLAPEIGDTIAMDLRLMIPMPDITLKRALLNGQPLTHVKNKAPFQVRYDQPGTYPLHFRVERNDWEQDSLYVYEKTYYLKVR